jgi:predicted Rossmann-fold nucleotide-binding protein
VRTAIFFGGVVRSAPADAVLARGIGRALGRSGFRLRHGGYNGLMEDAAGGAASVGADVVAVTLAGADWGPFNDSVTEAVHLPTLGARLDYFLSGADLVVAMGGGVGTLHELTAAIWYAGNVREVPVVLAGRTTLRLADFLQSDSWLLETPTRPLGFLRTALDIDEFTRTLAELSFGPLPAS